MVIEKDVEMNEENSEVTEEVKIEEEETSEKNDEKPEEELVQSERETQLKEQLIRLQADFTNYKRRSENEKKDYIGLGCQKVILELLPIIDNFERALCLIDEKDKFSEGVELIYNQLLELLTKNEVEEINELNTKFDPNLHHAVLVEEKDGVEEGIVIEILQKGYKSKEKVLRPAMVKVSK